MANTHTEIVSAFCDGEAVDPDALERALADPDARRLMVDCARLRESLRRADPLPDSLTALRREPFRTRRASAALRLAAALVIGIALGSYVLPRERPSTSVPPAAVRVLQFEPGVDWQSGGQ